MLSTVPLLIQIYVSILLFAETWGYICTFRMAVTEFCDSNVFIMHSALKKRETKCVFCRPWIEWYQHFIHNRANGDKAKGSLIGLFSCDTSRNLVSRLRSRAVSRERRWETGHRISENTNFTNRCLEEVITNLKGKSESLRVVTRSRVQKQILQSKVSSYLWQLLLDDWTDWSMAELWAVKRKD